MCQITKVKIYYHLPNLPRHEIEAVSLQQTREMAGIYTMGPTTPQSFTRGKRGLAGSLIFYEKDEYWKGQAPPFDIIIELDDQPALLLTGNELLTEGWEVDWADVKIGQQYTYISRGATPNPEENPSLEQFRGGQDMPGTTWVFKRTEHREGLWLLKKLW